MSKDLQERMGEGLVAAKRKIEEEQLQLLIFVVVLRKRKWAYLAQGKVEIGCQEKLVKYCPLESDSMSECDSWRAYFLEVGHGQRALWALLILRVSGFDVMQQKEPWAFPHHLLNDPRWVHLLLGALFFPSQNSAGRNVQSLRSNFLGLLFSRAFTRSSSQTTSKTGDP